MRLYRDQSFARDLIAAVERLRREREAREAIPEPDRCTYCGALREPGSDYCSPRCRAMSMTEEQQP